VIPCICSLPCAWGRPCQVPALPRPAAPVARAGAEAGRPVAGIGELAAFDREAATADAFGEPELEALELGDALIDPRCPRARETRPVAAGRRPLRRELGELRADLIERQPDSLGEHDECDAPEHRPRIAAVTRAGPFGHDQAPFLVESQRRSGHAAAPRDLADGEQGGHGERVVTFMLDLKLT
jgi:hypothetical protein